MSSTRNNAKKAELFVKTLRTILQECKKDVVTEEEKANMSRALRLYRLVPDDLKYSLSRTNILQMKTFIVARNFEDLQKFDITQLYKEDTDDESKQFTAEVMEIIKYRYPTMKEARRKIYWDLLNELVTYC
jgi:hypothetical protein